jgi:hypothetical protein
MWGEKCETTHDDFSGKNFEEELVRFKISAKTVVKIRPAKAFKEAIVPAK